MPAAAISCMAKTSKRRTRASVMRQCFHEKSSAALPDVAAWYAYSAAPGASCHTHFPYPSRVKRRIILAASDTQLMYTCRGDRKAQWTPQLTSTSTRRFASRGNDDYANKVLSAMRAGFGGHHEKPGK